MHHRRSDVSNLNSATRLKLTLGKSCNLWYYFSIYKMKKENQGPCSSRNALTSSELGYMTACTWESFLSQESFRDLMEIFSNCSHFLLGPGSCCLQWKQCYAVGILQILSKHPLHPAALSLHPFLPSSYPGGDRSKAPRPRVSFLTCKDSLSDHNVTYLASSNKVS